MIPKGDVASASNDHTLKLPARRHEQPWVGRALCFAGCVLVANALIGERGLSETLRAREAFRAAVADLSRLQYENAELAEEVRRLKQDSGTIESVARAELGLIKAGEILVVITNQPAPESTGRDPAFQDPTTKAPQVK